MSHQRDYIALEVEKLLKFNPRYQGAIILLGEEVIKIGEIKREIADILLNVINFIAMTFKQLMAGSPRFFVAEGEGYGVAYGKFGFNNVLILYYKDLPLGTVMYEIKALANRLMTHTG